MRKEKEGENDSWGICLGKLFALYNIIANNLTDKEFIELRVVIKEYLKDSTFSDMEDMISDILTHIESVRNDHT